MILIQKNVIAFGLFTVVMFIGVLKKGSKLHGYLMPVRAELSIVACLLSLGHVVVFVQTYYLRMTMRPEVMSSYQIAAVVCSAIFLVLMVPLLVTSFKRVHHLMAARSWKAVQFLAYPFYLLLFVHIFLFLVPPLASGTSSLSTMVNVGAYAVVCLAYIVLRLVRKRDKSNTKDEPRETASL
ncbi:MAG: ferric reductase-like transmembrane domain-containing protein [Coriobacteriaceae bacterium]|jgi:DMSO/TMAO reductase YedYZ heme-binding membrane subunit|nr:ferric reductase-like transmembrane domain-containing protein [Coriobacteriaceae bacterium]